MRYLPRSGALSGNGALPAFVPIQGGLVVFHGGAISRLAPDLDERVWQVQSREGDLWIAPETVLHHDRRGSGEWLLRRRGLADGQELLQAERPLGSVLTELGEEQVRLECGPGGCDLVGLNVEDLSLKWSRPWHPGSQMPTPTGEGLVLCGDTKRTSVVCIDVQDGKDHWIFRIPQRVSASDAEADAVAFGTGIVGTSAVVMVATVSGLLFKLDSATGAILGEGVRPEGQPSMVDDALWFVGVNGMHRFSVSTMRVEDYVDFRPATEGVNAAGWPRIHGVAHSDGVVAFRTSGGDLVALIRERTGWQACVAEIGGIAPFFEAPVIANDRIYCLDRAKYELLAFRY